MKRGLLILVLLIIPLASAAEIKLSKSIYQPEETLQAEIYGNFLENLRIENIHFYRERNVPVEYDILKLPDKYLLYAILPYKEGNYTLQIEDARYEKENVVTDALIIKEFKIQKGNQSYLTIDPGFVVAREDFYIQLESRENKQVVAEFLSQSKIIDLIQGRKEKIYFSISNVTNYTEAEIKILNYTIPVFIFPNKSETIEYPKFRFNPPEIKASIIKKQKHIFTVALINFGLENISDIKITPNSSDLSVEVSPSSISSLDSKSTKYLNLTISSEKEGDFDGLVIAETSNVKISMTLNIYVTENQSEIIIDNTTSPGYVNEKGCEEMGGSICRNDETCSVELEYSTDGFCCLGECKKESSEDYSWIYGLILIVALIGGLIGFSYYMKKKQNKPTDQLKKREDRFTQRMQPNFPPPSTEMRDSLSKT